eukprot:scaffold964_cov133-Chaetoceros_neogracile.AAC.1
MSSAFLASLRAASASAATSSTPLRSRALLGLFCSCSCSSLSALGLANEMIGFGYWLLMVLCSRIRDGAKFLLGGAKAATDSPVREDSRRAQRDEFEIRMV